MNVPATATLMANGVQTRKPVPPPNGIAPIPSCVETAMTISAFISDAQSPSGAGARPLALRVARRVRPRRVRLRPRLTVERPLVGRDRRRNHHRSWPRANSRSRTSGSGHRTQHRTECRISYLRHSQSRSMNSASAYQQSLRTHLVIRVDRILEISRCEAREPRFRRHFARDRLGQP